MPEVENKKSKYLEEKVFHKKLNYFAFIIFPRNV